MKLVAVCQIRRKIAADIVLHKNRWTFKQKWSKNAFKI